MYYEHLHIPMYDNVYYIIYYYSLLLLVFEVIVPRRVRKRCSCIGIWTQGLSLQSQAFSEVAYASVLQYLFGMLG